MRNQNNSTVSVTSIVYNFCADLRDTRGEKFMKSMSYAELAYLFSETTGLQVSGGHDMGGELPQDTVNIASFQTLVRRWVRKQL